MKTVRFYLGMIKDEFQKSLKTLLFLYLPIILIFAILAIQPFITISEMTRDVVDSTNIFRGIVSDAGLYLWAAASAICLLAAIIFYKYGQEMQHEAGFMLSAAAFSLFLLIDDRILLHDELIESGEVIYVAYVLLMFFFIYYYRRLILASSYIYFGLAMFFFAGSVGVDVVKDLLHHFDLRDVLFQSIADFTGTSYDSVYQDSYLLEDGLKFFGIITWLFYYLQFCIQELRPLSNGKE